MVRMVAAMLACLPWAFCGLAAAEGPSSQPATSPAPVEKNGLSFIVKPVKAVFGPKDKLALEFTFVNTGQDSFCIHNKLLDGTYADGKELASAADVTFTDTKTKRSWWATCGGPIQREAKNFPTVVLKPSAPYVATVVLQDNILFPSKPTGKPWAMLPPGVYEAAVTLRFESYPAKMRYWAGEIAAAPVRVEIAGGSTTTAATSPGAGVTLDEATKLAKAAATKSLEQTAGKGKVALGDPLIAVNPDACAFTWQGDSPAGGYIVTVRVDTGGKVEVLQSKVGAAKD